MTPRDVFISHSSKDAESARDLRAILEGAGYSCWMAPDDIVGTETWTEQILDAINDSRAMVVLVSAAANRSQHVSREVNLALGRDRAVLPVRIESVAPGGSLEYLLSLVQRVDALPPPVTDHRERILRRLAAVLEEPVRGLDATTPQPQPPPPPPPIAMPPGDVLPNPPRPDAPGRARVAVTIAAAVLVVAAIAVIAVAILGKPGSSPVPTGVAVASGLETAAPPTGGLPTGIPATTSVGGAPLSDGELTLFDRLPSLHDSSACTTWATPPGGDDVLSPSGYAGSIARITCPGPHAGDPPVRYAFFPDVDSVKGAFDGITTAAGVPVGGACKTAIPANDPWNISPAPNSGELACFQRDGRVQWVWTQNQLRVLVQWLAPDNAQGFNYWSAWVTTRNAAEKALLAALPAAVVAEKGCSRAPDALYPAALAIVACFPPEGSAPVYFARFPAATDFPNDPMTAQFSALMAEGGFPTDTGTGCFNTPPVLGNTQWIFQGDTSNTIQGQVGCYETSPGAAESPVRVVWTFNSGAILGQWDGPDLATGVDYVNTWIKSVAR